MTLALLVFLAPVAPQGVSRPLQYDFDGDAKSDILWRNENSSEVYMWFMNGVSVIGGGSLGENSLTWRIDGIGDFDGDRKSDIVWRNNVNRLTRVWFMNGASVQNYGSLGQNDQEWKIQ